MLGFVDLYESYAAEVYRFSFWLTGDAAEAEDITSDTFIRAWVRRSVIRTDTLKAYLFAIARNIYLERHRRTRRQVALENVHEDPAPGPDRLAESALRLQEVYRVLQALPEIDRAAFLMRVQHELPYAEIARALRISLAAAKVKVHRVRKKLLARRAESEDRRWKSHGR